MQSIRLANRIALGVVKVVVCSAVTFTVFHVVLAASGARIAANGDASDIPILPLRVDLSPGHQVFLISLGGADVGGSVFWLWQARFRRSRILEKLGKELVAPEEREPLEFGVDLAAEFPLPKGCLDDLPVELGSENRNRDRFTPGSRVRVGKVEELRLGEMVSNFERGG